MPSNFCQNLKPITISLSPNTEADDVSLAAKLIFQIKGCKTAVKDLEEKFKEYLGIKHVFSFNSGRSSLMAILRALEIKQGDEVILQGFTCNSAVNPILALKAKPVFVDIDNTLNLEPEDLKKKITPQTKAIMVQHTFGCPAKLAEIRQIASEHKLLLIEDCAHSLGAKYKGQLVGTFGDVAFFSFGRDKIISSVYGGMAVTNNLALAQRIKEFQAEIKEPSFFWTLQQLLHPILMNCLILPFYNFLHLGKIILIVSHWLRLLSKAVHKKEKIGEIPDYFPQKMPAALAVLAMHQFKKLERFNQHRQEIARFYRKELGKGVSCEESVFMRYPILVADSRATLNKAREKGIILNDGWREKAIVPPDTSQEKMGYFPGSCPKAEKVAQSIVNLPTHINISSLQAKKIVAFLKEKI